MMRAMQTAHAIADVVKLPLAIAPDYCETGGLREPAGMTRAQILGLYPTALLSDTITNNGWWAGPAESLSGAAQRAVNAAKSILQRDDPTAHNAVVTHGNFGSFLIQALLGLTPGVRGDVPCPYVDLCNTGITLLDIAVEGVYLRYHNRIDHLPADKVTDCAAP